MSETTISPDQLLKLRTATQALSQATLTRLRTQLDALAPLFRPRRFLGDHMEGAGREAAAGADKNAADLQAIYRQVALKPFDIRPELPTPFESVATQFHLHEWEYAHATQNDRGWQSIRVSTPLTWVVTFASPYSLTTLRDVVAGSAQRDTNAVRSFVFRACVMHELFRSTPSVTQLLTALRYTVEIRKTPQFGELPLVTISAPFRTFRPSDEMVTLAAGLAGGQSFAEIIDLDSVRNLQDPLREETIRVLGLDNTEGQA